MTEQKNETGKRQIPWWHRRKKKAPVAGKPLPEKPKLPNNYAFIDSQNLNLGVQKAGWKMNWRKFRDWLRDEYDVTHAYMFIGYMAENENLYQQMYDHGFLVVLKPTLEIVQVEKPGEKPKDDKEKVPVKGNIDADLVLHAMKELPNYDKAIIVSGDGDFFGLVEYLKEQGKLLKLMTPNSHYSSLLKQFDSFILNLENYRRDLNYRVKRRPSDRR
jgi:uncharacterized LabA/DUF88 family protein